MTNANQSFLLCYYAYSHETVLYFMTYQAARWLTFTVTNLTDSFKMSHLIFFFQPVKRYLINQCPIRRQKQLLQVELSCNESEMLLLKNRIYQFKCVTQNVYVPFPNTDYVQSPSWTYEIIIDVDLL